MTKGTVKWYNETKGYGFIKDAKSVFNSLGRAVDKVKDFFKKLQQPEKERSIKEFKAQSKTKDKQRSRGGMSR